MADEDATRSLTTITLKVHVEMFPDGSVAVTVTGVVPEKTEPEAGEYESVAEQLSVAVALKVAIAEQPLPVAEIVILFGQEITGTSLSTTITLNVHIDVLLDASITV